MFVLGVEWVTFFQPQILLIAKYEVETQIQKHMTCMLWNASQNKDGSAQWANDAPTRHLANAELLRPS